MTMTTTIDLDALERIAKAATPGPWQPYASQPEVSVMCSGKVLASIEVRNGFGWRDMEHIAAFSPTTALALIARVRELQKQKDNLCMLVRRLCAAQKTDRDQMALAYLAQIDGLGSPLRATAPVIEKEYPE